MILQDKLIIAVDFDGTIVEDAYPGIGDPMIFAFETLKKLQEDGHRLILWTYRHGKHLQDAVEFCKENDIEFQISFGLPYGEDVITTDETRLRQVLNNIIGNAIKFTRKGMVNIDYQLIDNYLIFTVKDTGIGISTQQKDLIFDRFSQADNTISREFGGTGLGLAISKACTELLGGKIWMKSELGHGTEMNFSIPYQKSEEV